MNLIILRGLPGAGKSTLAKLLSGGADVVCEADEFMVDSNGNHEFNVSRLGYAHGKCLEKFKSLVDAQNATIIVSNTSTRTKEFGVYKAYAEAHGYNVSVVIVENYHNNKSVHNVPEETMTVMRDRFQIKLC